MDLFDQQIPHAAAGRRQGHFDRHPEITVAIYRQHVARIDQAELHDVHRNLRVVAGLERLIVADENGNRIHLNGRDVSEEIRKMQVANLVSPVAVISEVRREMVRQQQAIGEHKGVVMDGRDIGTVVFPNAELKIFLTADVDERARRRFEELTAKGQHVNFEEVKRNLAERDHIDSTRADSPLRQAEDAVVIDNTHLNHEQQLELALDLVRERAEILDAKK